MCLLPCVKEVEWSALGNEENALELQLPLHVEVLHRLVLLPIVGEGLVEGDILVLGDLIRIAHPDGLLLVYKAPLVVHLLYLLLLLLLGLILHLHRFK